MKPEASEGVELEAIMGEVGLGFLQLV